MAPRSGKEKPIFRGLVIALGGTLGGQWTDTNIIRWVTLREGEYSAEMTDAVTHLVCSTDEFKTRGSRVKKALKRGHKSCKIVTKDWLEDCMAKKRRLPEKHYALDTEMKKERARKKKAMRHQKGLDEGIKAVNSNLYHHYHDATFFKYEVTISREEDGARYVMSLYESNAKPHLYWFVAKFYKRKGDSQPKFHRPSPTPRLFHHEFDEFKKFFLIKTGVSWEQRLMKVQGLGPIRKLYFKYEPPKGGKPVGYVPHHFMPIDEDDEPQKSEKEDSDNDNEENENDEEKEDDEEDVNAMVGVDEIEEEMPLVASDLPGKENGEGVPLVVSDLPKKDEEKKKKKKEISSIVSDMSEEDQKDATNSNPVVKRRWKLVPNFISEAARLFPAPGNRKDKADEGE